MTDALSDKAMRVYEAAVEMHGPFAPKPPRREPMHELISTLLSHRTTQANEAAAYESLREAFGSWEAIRMADEAEIAAVIGQSTFPEQKATYIKGTLTAIYTERGAYTLDFLDEMSTEAALDWLMELPGVGFKTATLVLLFNFFKPVLPVDTHVHRVSERTGLFEEGTSANKAHDILLTLLPEDATVLYEFHKGLLRHGQRVCPWSNPACERCPMTGFCDWYQANRA